MTQARTLRYRLYHLLEVDGGRDPWSRALNGALVILIIANVTAVVLETVPELREAYGPAFQMFEVVSVAIFTIEYLARIWSVTAAPQADGRSPTRVRIAAMLHPYAVIDLIAILPFYLSLLIGIDLRAMRIFRLLRFLKLVRHSTALVTLARVLRREARALFAALIIMSGLLILSATAMYHAEREAQPDVFGSIPAAMWWGVATLTTVGYGDMIPMTPLGKILGGCVMLFGLGMFALPVGIMATGFTDEIHRRDFVVTWGMVARAPLFQSLRAAEIAEVARILEARSIRTGALIMRAGDPADAMFFIQSGEVTLELPDGPQRLEEGDFFGEGAILRGGLRMASARAATETRLLVLEADDLLRLRRSNPTLATHLDEVARLRSPDTAPATERIDP
ncbi:MAG: cyclic nucleotide-gated ion channel [Pseudomonadota bacterium]